MTDLSELKRLAEAAKNASDDFDARPSPEAAQRVREALQELHELCYGGDILSLIKRVEEAEGVWNDPIAMHINLCRKRILTREHLLHLLGDAAQSEAERAAHARGVAEGLERAAKVADARGWSSSKRPVMSDQEHRHDMADEIAAAIRKGE